MRKMIKNLLESIFKKVDRQKLNVFIIQIVQIFG